MIERDLFGDVRLVRLGQDRDAQGRTRAGVRDGGQGGAGGARQEKAAEGVSGPVSPYRL